METLSKSKTVDGWMDLDDRVEILIDEYFGGVAKNLAQAAGITEGAVSKMRRGRTEEMSPSTAKNIIDHVWVQYATHLSKDWLMYGKGRMVARGATHRRRQQSRAGGQSSTDPAAEEQSRIVEYRMEEAGGGPARANGDTIPVDRRQLQAALGYVPDPEKAFWVRVRGRSVEPWISNGSIVLVEVCPEVKEPDYYVFWQDEEEGHLIKYMERVGGNAIRVTQYGPEPRSDVLEHEGDDVYRYPDGRTVRIDIKGRVAYPPLVGHSVLSTVTTELRKIVGS